MRINDKEMLHAILLVILIAAVLVFVLFGEEILDWLLHELKDSATSDLRQILD